MDQALECADLCADLIDKGLNNLDVGLDSAKKRQYQQRKAKFTNKSGVYTHKKGPKHERKQFEYSFTQNSDRKGEGKSKHTVRRHTELSEEEEFMNRFVERPFEEENSMKEMIRELEDEYMEQIKPHKQRTKKQEYKTAKKEKNKPMDYQVGDYFMTAEKE
jgi:hypothetical protein